MRIDSKILFTLLLASILCVPNVYGQNKKAMLVAVSNYGTETGWSTINSVNDIAIIKSSILKQGFKEENILVLTDEKAKKEQLLENFKKHLIDGLNEGDIAYFHFSGHGQQVQDFSGDEVDGFDESIVPYDGHAKFKKGIYEGENHLIDDELNVLYTELRKKLGANGHFLCTIDACHSGTSTRGLGSARGTAEVMASDDFINQLNNSNNSEIGQFGSTTSNESDMAGMVAFFGALAHQLNYELTGEDGKSYGSLSYAFSKALSELEEGASYRGLFERMRLKMVNTSSKQSPESEGKLDQAIFGGSFLGKPNYYAVKKKKRGGRIVLTSGFLHGLRKGSVVGFYPPETRDIENAELLSQGIVTSSLASEATVTLDSLIPDLDLEFAWAFILEESFGDLNIQVHIDDRIPSSNSLREKIYKLGFIEKSESVGDLNLMSNVSSLDLQTPGNITIATFSKNLLVDDLYNRLKKTLIEYAQAEYIKKLEQKNKQIALEFEFVPIDFDVDQWKETARYSLSEKMDHNRTIRFNEDDLVKLKIKNNGTHDAFFTVIDIQPNNQISVVIPNEGESPSAYLVKSGKEFETTIPLQLGPPFGQELFKLIASKNPIDLRPIASTRGMSTRGAQPDDPFEKLFSLSYIDEEVQTRGSRTLRMPKGKVNIYSQPFIIEEESDFESLSQLEASRIESVPNDVLTEDDTVDEGVFAYATSSSRTSRGGSASSELNYRKSVVQNILDDLINARGEFRMQKPTLVMKNQEKSVAWMNAKKVEIGLENKAYEVCQSFGADSLNAIAALLGHELTHYYDKHDWSRHFSRENRELRSGQRIASLKEGLKNETQADYLGGFLGYSAGYNTLGIMPKVLGKLYEAYNLPPELPGYPSLNDRAEIAKKSMDKLEILSSVFDMASYLTIIGDYSNARSYYEFVLKEFQSREIYNNLGVLSILDARQIIQITEFKLPLLLDGESRSKPRSRGEQEEIGGGGMLEMMEELIKEGINHFEVACQLDPEYIAARLNMACAYILLKDYDEAEYHLRKAKKLIDQSSEENLAHTIIILEGIIAAESEDKQLAKKKFTDAVSAGNAIAQDNLEILEGTHDSGPWRFPDEEMDQKEFIEDIELGDIMGEISVDNYVEFTNESSLNIKNMDASTIFIHQDPLADKHVFVQIAKGDYTGKTNKGVKIRDNKTLVEEKYGSDGDMLQVIDAVFVSYPDQGIIFQYDNNDLLKSWAVYHKN